MTQSQTLKTKLTVRENKGGTKPVEEAKPSLNSQARRPKAEPGAAPGQATESREARGRRGPVAQDEPETEEAHTRPSWAGRAEEAGARA